MRRYEHQVGGHMSADNEPECMVDSDTGRFLKPYQDGPRAIREEGFYLAIQSSLDLDSSLSPRHAAYPSASGLPNDEATSSSDRPRKKDVIGLVPFLPRFCEPVDR